MKRKRIKILEIDAVPTGALIRGTMLECEACGARFIGSADGKYCDPACKDEARRARDLAAAEHGATA